MNGCKNCKHWRPFDESADPVPDDFYNGPIVIDDRRGEIAERRKLGLCSLASERDHGIDSLAIAVDGSDYRHDLRTSPDFFCNQWVESCHICGGLGTVRASVDGAPMGTYICPEGCPRRSPQGV
jgi:hypothetical protein